VLQQIANDLRLIVQYSASQPVGYTLEGDLKSGVVRTQRQQFTDIYRGAGLRIRAR